MTKNDDKRVPALRFKGFNDDWAQRKLGDVTQRVQGNNNDMNLPILTISAKNGWMTQVKRFSNIIAGAEKKKYTLLKKGELSYNHGNSKLAPFGTVFMLDSYSEALVPKVYHSFKTGKDIEPYFVELYFHTKKVDSQLRKYISSSARMDGLLNITYNWFKQIKIFVPKMNEQNKLKKIFLILNKYISLQQRKAQQLKLLKKAMLQDIFPNTQGIRQIKLSNNIWVEKRMVDIFKEKNIRSKNGELLSVSISKGIYPFSNSERKNNSSTNKSNYKKVTPGDIAYNSMRMWQGALGVSKYNGIVSPAYTVMATKEKENPLFYYYYFKNTRMMFSFRQHSQGLTSDTWNLKFPLLKKIAIQIPINKNEEEKIIKLFESIDIAITSIELKIEKLKAVKQFLLQNMFI
ncbi:restriction endonuclease subunit S [Lactobacillus crispatus]|uniref:Restriction endonuclease subunit S n=1 Tax=Lactobacillus crispatus TaxID=47770 RepID=A0AB37DFM5_9LACO|nr:restriction endonuclease subunit S [Lactobacillus crispatus]OCX08850.1 type I restriction endonuclease subunit S [Lactobacillus crispatus]QHQ68032.1 restriction endonuclease subunit S [Lactobacillus crispatus]